MSEQTSSDSMLPADAGLYEPPVVRDLGKVAEVTRGAGARQIVDALGASAV